VRSGRVWAAPLRRAEPKPRERIRLLVDTALVALRAVHWIVMVVVVVHNEDPLPVDHRLARVVSRRPRVGWRVGWEAESVRNLDGAEFVEKKLVRVGTRT